ncbi:MAG: acyltransferase family protein [Arcticibacter sp.]
MNLTTTTPVQLETKQHFEILDGLRGVAAFAVLVFHFMEYAAPDIKDNFIAHAYLAVDFFFCLSGFVIAYAYDGRLEKMGKTVFFKLRLIRLHPLVLIGSVIGLLTFLFDPFRDLFHVYGSGGTFMLFITSCLMIPYPVVEERYFNFFNLNAPSWSLFWEYVANIFYALVLIKVRNKLLWFLTVLAAVLICYEADRSGSLLGGWGKGNFLGGGIRVFYSFLAGVLVYRSNWIIRSRLGFLSMSVLLMLAFLVPYTLDPKIVDPVIVLFYFPLLVALGAGARLNEGFRKVCRLSGDISYPLYMTHYPFLFVFGSYMEAVKPDKNQLILVIFLSVVALLALAYCIMVFVDIPMRKYLKNRLVSRNESF